MDDVDRFRRRLMIPLPPDGWRRSGGGNSGGDIPRMMVIGLETGDVGRVMAPLRLWLTASRRYGYQAEEVDASVGKSRMYINLGRDVLGGRLIRESKKTLTLLGGTGRFGFITVVVLPPLRAGANTVSIICWGEVNSGSLSFSSSKETDAGLEGGEDGAVAAKCNGLRGSLREFAAW